MVLYGTCDICGGDFEWPLYTCDCGREITQRDMRELGRDRIDEMRAAWAAREEETAGSAATEAGQEGR